MGWLEFCRQHLPEHLEHLHAVQPDDRDVDDPLLVQHRLCRIDLGKATVDDDEVGWIGKARRLAGLLVEGVLVPLLSLIHI